AHLLIARGVGRGSLVALALPRSADSVAAVLGVQKAGAAHLPIDPDHPSDRVAAMFADARPDLVLTTTALASGVVAGAPVEAIRLDDADVFASIEAMPDTRPGAQHAPTLLDASYVIYTSGSTGRPKGVVCT